MVKLLLDLTEKENRVLNIVKALQGFKNKVQAVNFVIDKYEENLESEIRPEFVKELKKIEKGKHYSFKDINDLRRQIEG